jgi:acyl-CoA synthetase (AMP-forming)/AMP-acid ligase II
VKIVDDERDPVALGRGSIGEIAVHSASLFAGYWDDPEATAAVVEDGWYYSGDLGAIDEEGYIFIADRGKNLIRSGGMNVYPAEIEVILERCPGIAESAVVGAPHPQWGEAPVAVVVAEPGAELSEAEVIGFVTERLASYKKPSRVLFVDELPRTTGGKIVRQSVRDIAAGPGGDGDAAPAGN